MTSELIRLPSRMPVLTKAQRKAIDPIPDPNVVRAWDGSGVVVVYVYNVMSVTRHLIDLDGECLETTRFRAGTADSQIRRALLAGLAAR